MRPSSTCSATWSGRVGSNPFSPPGARPPAREFREVTIVLPRCGSTVRPRRRAAYPTCRTLARSGTLRLNPLRSIDHRLFGADRGAEARRRKGAGSPTAMNTGRATVRSGPTPRQAAQYRSACPWGYQCVARVEMPVSCRSTFERCGWIELLEHSTGLDSFSVVGGLDALRPRSPRSFVFVHSRPAKAVT